MPQRYCAMTDFAPCKSALNMLVHEAGMPSTLPPPRILPRAQAAPMYQKKCEMCARPHSGTFGAGRFCSSRCARTVGGLAHRKKRQMERSRSTVTTSRTSTSSGEARTTNLVAKTSSKHRHNSTQSRMLISSLLNPSM